MSDAIQTYTIAEFLKTQGNTLAHDVEFSIYKLEEIHNDIPVKSPLFRANYYTIVLIRDGQGRYIIDSQAYDTRNRTIYFTNPGHVKGFAMHRLTYGYVMTFGESFLKQYVSNNILDEFPFLIAEVVPPRYPEPDIFQVFDDLGTQILREYQTDSVYRFKIIGSLTVVLLLKIKEHFWNHYNPLTESSTGSAIVLTFQRNLETHIRDLVRGQCDRIYQVQDYAQVQHLHPSYFSTVIKRKTGKSVTTWISEKVIAEAQTMLARTQDSIQEIAFRLGFKDAAHFSRFFKKNTQMSPSSFRQTLNM